MPSAPLQTEVRAAMGQWSVIHQRAGLPEYNVFGGTYELTLIRATSKMGDWGTFPSAPSRFRPFPCREGRSFTFGSVLSQEPGIHHFEYAVIPHSAGLFSGAVAVLFVHACLESTTQSSCFQYRVGTTEGRLWLVLLLCRWQPSKSRVMSPSCLPSPSSRSM